MGFRMCWLNENKFDFNGIPLVYHGWLNADGCMSIACKNVGYTFVVEVLKHGIHSLDNVQHFVRNVLIRINGIESIYGITQAPMHTYLQYKEIFDSLGSKPIGENLLFKEGVTKDPVKYKKINYHDELARDVIKYNSQKEILFARKDVFDIHSFSLSLAQIFLPNIPQYPNSQKYRYYADKKAGN